MKRKSKVKERETGKRAQSVLMVLPGTNIVEELPVVPRIRQDAKAAFARPPRLPTAAVPPPIYVVPLSGRYHSSTT